MTGDEFGNAGDFVTDEDGLMDGGGGGSAVTASTKAVTSSTRSTRAGARRQIAGPGAGVGA